MIVMNGKLQCFLAGFLLTLVATARAESPSSADGPDATDIVKQAIDAWRGSSSYSEMTMTIHRPDWQRSMSMRAWTLGEKHSLVRVTAPKKDAGTGTLLIDNAMWTFSPKVNRVIKVPSSMMGQSWMGSDFSNRDIAKSDDIVEEYTHTLLETREQDGHTVYQIESVPHETAAVVWGRQVLTIRDDFVMMREEFYDQDNELVKVMETLNIEEMDGRAVAQQQRMVDMEEKEKWTEVTVQEVDFEVSLNDNVFTLSNLRNPRD